MQPTVSANFRDPEFKPTILKRGKYDLEELAYFNLLKTGNYLQNDVLVKFITQFPKIFSSLLDKCSNDNERKTLITTPLCDYRESTFDNNQPFGSHFDTKPIIFAAYSGSIELLEKIDKLLPDLLYTVRLSNGFNLLHCLVEGECLNIESSTLCISFFLGKNKEMLIEKDANKQTPLDLCRKTIQMLEHSKTLQKGKLDELTVNLTLYNRQFAIDVQKLMHDLTQQIRDMEKRLDNLIHVRSFLENKAQSNFSKRKVIF